MLILTRRQRETIVIDGRITVTIMKTGRTVQLGIEAPSTVAVNRGEVHQRILNAESNPDVDASEVRRHVAAAEIQA
ncbi:MAG: carbon storage regulator [Planctomycetales bacterium]|nr:carbon storage regulator [Planctomycetales bacterium]